MQFFQGYLYALRLKPQKEALLRRWVGCRRWVWNEALAFQRSELEACRPRPTYAELSARLPVLKKANPWLADPPAQALQQTLKDLCEAWDKHRTSGAGAPRFKARGEGESLRFVQDLFYDAHGGRIRLPKLGFVRMRHSRVAEGVLKNAAVRQERGRWVVSLQMRRDVDEPLPVGTAAVGLDFGVATTIMPSAGAPIELPVRLSKYERRIKRLQQALTRKKKGSKNRRKARGRLARCHAKAVAIRRDFLHKATTALVEQHELIAVEDLRVQQMTRSSSGTSDRPGKCVKRKRGLNRTILRQGWALARRMLEYKGARRGVRVVAVEAAFTSQTCAACGHVDRASRPTRSAFACVACGHHDQADRNAAKNILARALASLCQVTDSPSSGCSASTAGYAGTHACEAGSCRLRPRPAAQGRSAAVAEDGSLAGTVSGLEPPRKFAKGGRTPTQLRALSTCSSRRR